MKEQVTIDVTYGGGVGQESKHYRGPAEVVGRHPSITGCGSISVRFKPLGAREYRTLLISPEEIVNDRDTGISSQEHGDHAGAVGGGEQTNGG